MAVTNPGRRQPPAPTVRRVIGIDPGLAATGWGVVEKEGNKLNMIAFGALRPPARLGLFGQLLRIRDGLVALIGEHRPTEMAVEEIFLYRNPRSALTLGHARGTAIVAGLEMGLSLHEYTALQVKKALTGVGRAEKQQVQWMVKTILRLSELPQPEDASDALGVAVTHLSWIDLPARAGVAR